MSLCKRVDKMPVMFYDDKPLSKCLTVTSKSIYTGTLRSGCVSEKVDFRYLRNSTKGAAFIYKRNREITSYASENRSKLTDNRLKAVGIDVKHDTHEISNDESASCDINNGRLSHGSVRKTSADQNVLARRKKRQTSTEGLRHDVSMMRQSPLTSELKKSRPATVGSSVKRMVSVEPFVVRPKTVDSSSHRRAKQEDVSTGQSSNKTVWMEKRRQVKMNDIDRLDAVHVLLKESLLHDDLMKFVSTLRSMDSATRRQVINVKVDDDCNSLFFTACQLSRFMFIDYMLSECHPDLELQVRFTTGGHDSLQVATPLWLAATSGNLPLTQLLISHQAEINTISSTGSTAVMAACSGGQLDTVYLLITNGADIHIKNDQGMTCLMVAIQYPEIILLLVKCGARVNESDGLGNTALHYAAELGHLQTVKLLVDLGANPLIDNLDKCNAILTAAKARREKVVEFLISVRTPKAVEIITAYTVLGATVILADDNYHSGLIYWQKAIALRKMIFGHRHKMSRSVLSECFDADRWAGLNEDVLHMGHDQESLSHQAMVICEGLHGPRHPSFTGMLMFRGAVCADNGNFLKSLQFWKLSYKLSMDNMSEQLNRIYLKDDVLHSNMTRNVINMVQILFRCLKFPTEDHAEHTGDNCVPESLTRELFQLIFRHMEMVKHNHGCHPHGLSQLMQCCLVVLFSYIQMYPSHCRHPSMGGLIQGVIHLAPRGDSNQTLLHMCLDGHLLDNLTSDQRVKHHWPSYELMDILLLLGANPLVRDSHGDTILHYTVSLYITGVTIHPGLVSMMLRRGVHHDQVNHKGQSAFDLIPSGDSIKRIVYSCSLKCLAARIVARHKINYIGEIPTDLYSFVELHVA